MKIYGITDVGLKRQLNEDSYFVKEYGDNKFIAVVSDGMGGHNAGEVASKLVINSIVKFAGENDCFKYVDIKIKKAISAANYNVYLHSIKNKKLNGMGATLVVGIYNGKKMYVGNLGDSRAYHIHNGEIAQITSDHSFVYELVKSGIITQEESKTHPQRNEITKAIGIAPEAFPDIYEVAVKQGDSLLICSDGLSNMCDDNLILDIILKNDDIKAGLKELVKTANQNGGSDNITAILVKF